VSAPSHRCEPGAEGHLEVRVPAMTDQVSQVRRALGDIDLPAALLMDAQLLVTELVTNSIEHAGLVPGDEVRVHADWRGDRLRVDVYDRAGRPSPDRVAGAIRPAPGSESGWGLYLVDRLASRWGTGRGRCWFELETDDRGLRSG
jgi:serine/threonine-protein kinase RsbW